MLRREGFTIVELLAAMVISSLVVALVYSMYLVAQRMMDTWENRTELSSAVHQCAQTIYRDAVECSALYECNDSTLVLRTNRGDTVCYEFSKNNVWRDSVAFLPSNGPGPDQVRREPYRLVASVGSTVDTTTASGWPIRLWIIRVIGSSGDLVDSSDVELTSVISSEEIVRAHLSTGVSQ